MVWYYRRNITGAGCLFTWAEHEERTNQSEMLFQEEGLSARKNEEISRDDSYLRKIRVLK